ncbi:transposase [Methylobacterium trifolii]|uniref:transposase n=1 Tax=Methylobacterium trifolii TaxID=1003092 RepID=UPI001EDDA934|nr:transposase [Methylobacterium trifolii]
MAVDEGRRAVLKRWLEPLMAALGHLARRGMCPFCVAGLINLAERKSAQPRAARADVVSHEYLQHSIAVIWDGTPLSQALLMEADRRMGNLDPVVEVAYGDSEEGRPSRSESARNTPPYWSCMLMVPAKSMRLSDGKLPEPEIRTSWCKERSHVLG